MNDKTLLEFPCRFPIKIIGLAEADFSEAICALVQQFASDFDPATVEMRPSSTARYLGLTCTIQATSQAQLDDLYRALTAHPLVKVVL